MAIVFENTGFANMHFVVSCCAEKKEDPIH